MKKKTDTIIDKIKKIREKNNECWMLLLKLAFASNENEAKKIFKNILENDKKISELSKELVNE